MTVRVRTREEVMAAEAAAREEADQLESRMRLQHPALGGSEEGREGSESLEALEPFKRFGKKIGRNDPCPCGSGKKYKACHGKLT